MDMIEADDIDDFFTQMIKERKNVVLYKNEKEEDILRVMLKSTHCPACSTTNSKCQTCGINVCDLHSPDAEEAKSKRHCEACFKKWWQKKSFLLFTCTSFTIFNIFIEI